MTHMACYICDLEAATAGWESYALNSRVINEPTDSPLALVVDQPARQLVALVGIEYLFHDLFLAATCRYKGDLESSLRDWE